MKDVSDEYLNKEESHKIKPVEIYHIWRGSTHWRYTSGDVAIVFNGNTYVPATIKRSLVEYDSSMEITKMNFQAAFVEDPALEFMSINPIEIIWIEVMRLHRDQEPLEADVVFVGQIKDVDFKGVQANAECVGFEFFLSMPIPRFRYQLTCNWTLFDEHCLLDEESYEVETIITLDASGTVLTSSDFGSYEDGYFIFGPLKYGDSVRTIVGHIGDAIVINYRIKDLESGNTVKAYPGCDGRIDTCQDKFNNLLNFLGFPFIPEENPTLRYT
jgi:uncharacterized phage protein (TIGR02218 family)